MRTTRTRVKQARRPKHVPQRTCISCHETKPKRELVRLVRTIGGGVEVDPSGKSPGRGAYLCRRPVCWENASKKGHLDRALRMKSTPEDRARLADLGRALCFDHQPEATA